MKKLKNLSAMLLAVVMMMFVMTGCGGTNPTSRFIQVLNGTRQGKGYTTVVEDNEMTAGAQEMLDIYTGALDGKYTAEQVTMIRNELLGRTVGITHGTGTITLVGAMTVNADLYNSGNYTLTGAITYTDARYIGVATTQRGSTVIISVIMAK